MNRAQQNIVKNQILFKKFLKFYWYYYLFGNSNENNRNADSFKTAYILTLRLT